MDIGSWVRRTRRGRAKWHLVESVISEAAVTKCGLRMEPIADSDPLEVSEVQPLTRMIGQPQNCRRCSPF